MLFDVGPILWAHPAVNIILNVALFGVMMLGQIGILIEQRVAIRDLRR